MLPQKKIVVLIGAQHGPSLMTINFSTAENLLVQETCNFNCKRIVYLIQLRVN